MVGWLWWLLDAAVVTVALGAEGFWLISAAGLCTSVDGGFGEGCWGSRLWDRCSPLAVSKAAFSFK